jgi:leader peptidase (prepilin peptidase) / N-methyltransferase
VGQRSARARREALLISELAGTAPVAALGTFGIVSAGLFGLLVGSFVNVLIHRLPREESIVHPGSHCPACGGTIRPLDNVPLFSWLLLGGRCRTCRAPIPVRYPLVELSNGALWAAAFGKAPSPADFASGAFLCSACLALLWIDADFQILPDAITLPGIVVGLALSFFSLERTPKQALLGAVLGAFGLFSIGWVWSRLRNVDAMGLGDVKMLGMVGAFLGPWGVFMTVFFGSVLGSLVGLSLIVSRKGSLRTAIPFGVFLAIGAGAAYFFGAPLLSGYRSLWP